jgi:hypothetical protein
MSPSIPTWPRRIPLYLLVTFWAGLRDGCSPGKTHEKWGNLHQRTWTLAVEDRHFCLDDQTLMRQKDKAFFFLYCFSNFALSKVILIYIHDILSFLLALTYSARTSCREELGATTWSCNSRGSLFSAKTLLRVACWHRHRTWQTLHIPTRNFKQRLFV